MERIALYAGGFRPPHGGHYDSAKYLLKNSNADSVLVIVGPKERGGITAEMAIKIWDMYMENDPDPYAQRINIVPTRSATPVRDVYELVEKELPNGSEVYLGVGEKETDGRWDNVKKYADPKNIKFEVIPIPALSGGISGTQMREFIANGDREEFTKYVPKHLTEQEIQAIWELLTDELKEIIDEGVKDFFKKNRDKLKTLFRSFGEAWYDQRGSFWGYKDIVIKYLKDKNPLTDEEKTPIKPKHKRYI